MDSSIIVRASGGMAQYIPCVEKSYWRLECSGIQGQLQMISCLINILEGEILSDWEQSEVWGRGLWMELYIGEGRTCESLRFMCLYSFRTEKSLTTYADKMIQSVDVTNSSIVPQCWYKGQICTIAMMTEINLCTGPLAWFLSTKIDLVITAVKQRSTLSPWVSTIHWGDQSAMWWWIDYIFPLWVRVCFSCLQILGQY